MKTYALLLSLCLSLNIHAAALTVQDTKDRVLTIDLIKLHNDQVTFTKKGSPKTYTIPLQKFSGSSQEKIKEAAQNLPSSLPELKFDNITVSKRRKDRGKSYYMEQQEIIGSIRIKNTSNTETFEPCTTTVVVFGQDQKRTKLHKVLTQQIFTTQPGPNESVEHDLESVITEYDSDNKGRGNIGGFAFCGYIITVKTEDGRLVLEKVIGGTPRKAVKNDPTLLGRIDDYTTDLKLTEALQNDKKAIKRIGVTRY